VDYIFRWMGSRFLPPEERASLGLVDRSSAAESSVQPLTLGLGGYAGGGAGGAGTSGSGTSDAAGPASPLSGNTAVAAPEESAPTPPPASESLLNAPHAAPSNGSTNGHANGNGNGNGNGSANAAIAKPRITLGNMGIGKAQVTFTSQADAPSCAECGSIMVRNGSCYKCLNCGSTSGCS
jgi:ribonucleoside-diphosphate reductase alpha chain